MACVSKSSVRLVTSQWGGAELAVDQKSRSREGLFKLMQPPNSTSNGSNSSELEQVFDRIRCTVPGEVLSIHRVQSCGMTPHAEFKLLARSAEFCGTVL